MKIEMLRDVTAQVGFYYEGMRTDEVRRTFKKGSVLTVESNEPANNNEEEFITFTEEQTPEQMLQVKLPRDSFKANTLRAFRTNFLFSIDEEELDELPRKPISLRQVKNFLNEAVVPEVNTEDHGNPVGFASAEIIIEELEELSSEEVVRLYYNKGKKKVVVGRLTPDERKAIAFARNILSSFKDTNLYEDYRDDEEDGFTDEEYDAMFDILDKIK